MGATNQEIYVRIKTLIDGLGDAKEYHRVLAAIKKEGGKKFAPDITGGGSLQGNAQKITNLFRTLSGTSDNLSTRFENVAAASGLASTALGGPYAVAAAAAAGLTIGLVAAGYKFIEMTVEQGSRLNDLSIKTGLSVETLSGLELQLTQSGSSLETFSDVVFDMQKRLEDAAGGNKELRRSFADLGVEDADAALRDTEGTVRKLFKGLGDLTDEGERNAKGSEVLGRKYKELSVFLGDTGGEIDAVIEKARALGLVLSREDVEAADRFGDEMDVLKVRATAAIFQITSKALPQLEMGLQDITNALGSNVLDWEVWGRSIGGIIAGVRGGLKGVMLTLATRDPQSLFKNVGFFADFEMREEAIRQALALGGGNKRPSQGPRAPRAGNGGGGGSAAKKDFSKDLFESELDARRGQLNRDFDLFKDNLDREHAELERRLRDNLVSLGDYYREKERLQALEIDAEIGKLGELDSVNRRQFFRAQVEIERDENLTPKQKEQKQQIELNKYQEKYLETEKQIAVLEAKRGEVTRENAAGQKAALAELEAQARAVRGELDELMGGAAVGGIDERFRKMRESFVANFGAMSDEVRKLDELVLLLKRHAQFDAQLQRLNRTFGQLGLEEQRVDADQLLEGFSDEEAERRKLRAAQRLRAELESQHRELKAIAEATKDPELLQAAKRLEIEISTIGVHVDKIGRKINEDIRGGLKDTLAGIIRDVGSAGERLLALVNQILDQIASLLADRIIESVFGPGGVLDGVLGGKGKNGSAGGVGGILSKILGFPSGGSSKTDGAITSLPGVIKDFQGGALSGIAGMEAQLSGDLFGLLGAVGQSNNLLGEIASGIRVQTGAIAAQKGLEIAKLVKDIFFAGSSVEAATGGFITGPGTETSDSILARLSKHEFVVKASSVRGVGVRALEYINRHGELPIGFASGGLVEDVAALPIGSAAASETHFHLHPTYQVEAGGKLTRASQAAVERDSKRLVQRGASRARRNN